MATKLPPLNYGRCELFYKTDLSEDNWIRLVTSTTDRKFNLKKIIFDAGVTLYQASAGVIESCSVHINPVEDSISIEARDDQEARDRVFKVEFECLSIAAPEFETKAAKRESGIAKAKTLPLANVCGSFKAIRLEKFDLDEFKGMFRPKLEHVAQQIRVRLVPSTVGKASHDPQAFIGEAFATGQASGPSALSAAPTPVPSLPRPTLTPNPTLTPARSRVSSLPGPILSPTIAKPPTTSPLSPRAPTSAETAKDTPSMAMTTEAKLAAHRQRVKDKADQIIRETAEEKAAAVAAVEAKGQARLAWMHAAAQKEEDELMAEVARLERS